MTDLEHILPLWRELESAGADYVLATVVGVEGSSYRRPGARMLLAQDGRRAGTVSGGCLEAAVAKKAWWLTESGPVVERYSTLDDDGDLPYGSGCGGIVYILLERRATASPLLHALKAAWERRKPLSIATVLEGAQIGKRVFAGLSTEEHLAIARAELDAPPELRLAEAAEEAFAGRQAFDGTIPLFGVQTRVWVDYRAARPGLWIFGAGDDARPLTNLARELGWFVAVADGRSHLATRTRFAKADEVHAVDIQAFPKDAPTIMDVHPTDAVLLVTHSFEQDSRFLAWLLDRGSLPAYVGVLGPQRRTREALAEAARLLGRAPSADLVEELLEELHAPTGLDLGADTPASIALSILSEVQKVLSASTALPLRTVRATSSAITSA
ncbi:XdhC family protein [Acidobacteria bacterium AB60]|nr:XdhC family protein [Acidobacteria bacterium AB60]